MVFIVILIFSFLLQLALPWWSIVVVCFATSGLIGKTAKISFWQSFFAIVILWSGVMLYKSIPNQHLLATRVAQMFEVKYWLAVLGITALLGGLSAGISGYCGYLFRKTIIAARSKKTNCVFLPRDSISSENIQHPKP